MAVTGPVLSSERLDLWRPVKSDLTGIVKLLADGETRRHLGAMHASEADCATRLLRNAGSWALHGYGTFIVRRRGEAGIIGNCGIFHSWRGFGKGMDDTPEAGWIIRHDCWGQGLAGEAMRAVIDWFDTVHGSQRVACMIEQGNTASERLAARLGFIRYDQHAAPEGGTLVLYQRPG